MDPSLRKAFSERVAAMCDASARNATELRRAANELFPDEDPEALLRQVRKVQQSGWFQITFGGYVWSNMFHELDRVKFSRVVRRQFGLPDTQDTDTIFADTMNEIVRREVFPANWMEMAKPAPIPQGKKIGEVLVMMGAASPADIAQGLELQNRLQKELGVFLKLGVVLLFASFITAGEYMQALGYQAGVQSTNLDELFDRVAKYL